MSVLAEGDTVTYRAGGKLAYRLKYKKITITFLHTCMTNTVKFKITTLAILFSLKSTHATVAIKSVH